MLMAEYYINILVLLSNVSTVASHTVDKNPPLGAIVSDIYVFFTHVENSTYFKFPV